MYHGDIRLGDSIHIKFTTVNTSGVPTTLAGTPVVSAYPADSLTQLTAGITLTADFDAVTGLNHVTVAATSGNGYATATNYTLVITTGTVGGSSVVGYTVGSFSIENRSALMPTTAARTLDVAATGEAGVDFSNINGTLDAAEIGTGAITAAKFAAGAIDAAAIATGAIDADAIAADAITAAKIAAGAIDAATFAAGAIDATSIATGAITAAKFAAGAIDAAALAADAGTEIAAAVWDRDATLSQTQGTFGQAVGDPVADTNTIYKAVVTDATGATVGVDVVAVQADTDNIQTRLPAALVAGRMDADVGAMQAGVVTAAAIATGAIDADALAADASTEIRSVASGTSDSGTTTTMVDAARTEADTDYWVGSIIVFTSGTIAGQARYITAFTPATDTITFAPATTQAVSTQTYEIWPSGDYLRPTVSGRTLDVSAGGEAGVDWANVGTQGTAVNLSATTVNLVNTLTTYTGNTPQTGDAFARLGAPAGASVSADILVIDNFVDDLESRLGVPSNLGSGATIAANLVDIENQTDDIGVAGAGLTAVPWNAAWDAEVQSEVQDALTLAITGTSDSGTTTTMVDAARTEADTDYWKGALIRFTSGNILGQTRLITAFDPATDTITFAPATTQAVATQNYEILAAGRADLQLWLGAVVNALVSGRVDASAGALAANVVTAAATAADFLAEINAEVVDVMATDTITLPGQAAPPLAPTHREMISWLYKVLRNRQAQTSTQWSLYADNETTVDTKATVSDDGVTAIRQELVSGP